MILAPFLVFLGLLVCAVASSSFGTFSIFRTRSIKAFRKAHPAVMNDSKFGKLRMVHTAVVRRNVTQDSVLEVISRFLGASEHSKHDNVEYTLGHGSCLLIVPRRPIGWTNIAFDVATKLEDSSIAHGLSSSGSGADEVAQLTFSSFGSKNGLRVQFAIVLKDGNLVVKRRCSSQESSKLVSVVIDTLESVLVGFLNRELALKEARSQQFRASKLLSDATVKARKRQELDRIIHPEKYRTKSATVRRDGADSGGGSGRYTPSASTQARRTKSRGG